MDAIDSCSVVDGVHKVDSSLFWHGQTQVTFCPDRNRDRNPDRNLDRNPNHDCDYDHDQDYDQDKVLPIFDLI